MDYLVVIPPSAKGLQGEGKSLSLLTSCGKPHMNKNRISKNLHFQIRFFLFIHALIINRVQTKKKGSSTWILVLIKLNMMITISEWASVSFRSGGSNWSLSTVNEKKLCSACVFFNLAHNFGTRGHQCSTLQDTQILGNSRYPCALGGEGALENTLWVHS